MKQPLMGVADTVAFSAEGPGPAKTIARAEEALFPPTWGPEKDARIDLSRGIFHEGAMIFFRRANAYVAVKNYRRALADYTRALDYSSKTPEIFFNRAIVHDRTGNLREAIGDYTAAVKIDPRYAKAYCNRAALYRKEGKTEKALQDMREAAGLGLKEMQAYLRAKGIAW